MSSNLWICHFRQSSHPRSGTLDVVIPCTAVALIKFLPRLLCPLPLAWGLEWDVIAADALDAANAKISAAMFYTEANAGANEDEEALYAVN